jgi:hypothetical protein
MPRIAAFGTVRARSWQGLAETSLRQYLTRYAAKETSVPSFTRIRWGFAFNTATQKEINGETIGQTCP